MRVRYEVVGNQALGSVDSGKMSADPLEASPIEADIVNLLKTSNIDFLLFLVSQAIVWYKPGYHITSNPTLSHLKPSSFASATDPPQTRALRSSLSHYTLVPEEVPLPQCLGEPRSRLSTIYVTLAIRWRAWMFCKGYKGGCVREREIRTVLVN